MPYFHALIFPRRSVIQSSHLCYTIALILPSLLSGHISICACGLAFTAPSGGRLISLKWLPMKMGSEGSHLSREFSEVAFSCTFMGHKLPLFICEGATRLLFIFQVHLTSPLYLPCLHKRSEGNSIFTSGTGTASTFPSPSYSRAKTDCCHSLANTSIGVFSSHPGSSTMSLATNV